MLNYFFKGDTYKLLEGAKCLLEYGERTINNRSKVLGYWLNTFANYLAGDFESAQKNGNLSLDAALDPLYAQFPKVTLGLIFFSTVILRKLKKYCNHVVSFAKSMSWESFLLSCHMLLSPIFISKGNMKQGFELLENARKNLITNQRRVWYAVTEHILVKFMPKSPQVRNLPYRSWPKILDF